MLLHGIFGFVIIIRYEIAIIARTFAPWQLCAFAFTFAIAPIFIIVCICVIDETKKKQNE